MGDFFLMMPTFESQYNLLHQYAVNFINKHKSSLSPDDLINEAYVRMAGEEYSLEKFQDKMRGYLFEEMRLSKGFEIIGGNVKLVEERVRVCCCCNETLPVAAFRLRKSNDHFFNMPRTECISCENKKRREKRAKVEKRLKLKAVKTHKTCKMCGETKELSAFHKRPSFTSHDKFCLSCVPQKKKGRKLKYPHLSQEQREANFSIAKNLIDKIRGTG